VAYRRRGIDFKSRASASFATRAGKKVIENTISVELCELGSAAHRERVGYNFRPCGEGVASHRSAHRPRTRLGWNQFVLRWNCRSLCRSGTVRTRCERYRMLPATKSWLRERFRSYSWRHRKGRRMVQSFWSRN